MQQAAGAGGAVVAVHFLQPLVRLGHRFPIFVGEGVGFGLHRRMDGGVTGQHEVQRGIRQMRGFLRHAGDARLARQVDVAAVGLHIAHQGSEQAGLAGAIAADHAHAVAGMKGQVDIGQQQAFAPAQGEIAEGNHPDIVLRGPA